MRVSCVAFEAGLRIAGWEMEIHYRRARPSLTTDTPIIRYGQASSRFNGTDAVVPLFTAGLCCQLSHVPRHSLLRARTAVQYHGPR